MKTKLFLLLSIWWATLATAQKVVALHGTNGVQFFSDDNSFQSAYDAAVDNDTIYLPGGSFAPPAKFEKKLRIYGAGHYPSATVATYPTIISGNFILSDEADGFYLEGVEITGSLSFESNESINDVLIKRCKTNGLSIPGDRTNPSENCVFQENIFPDMSLENLINSSFFNNIIQGRIDEARSLNFLNNLFLYSYYYHYVIDYANSCMIKNNVFLEENYSVVGGDGQSTYSHNIFAYTGTGNISLGTDPVTIDNYTMTRDNILVNQTGDTFDYTQDYHLTPDAQANLGDDDTECGIYGGFYPWKEESIPSNPHISSKDISNVSDENGMIHIDINVHAQDR